MNFSASCNRCNAAVQAGSRYCAACGHEVKTRLLPNERRSLTFLFCDLVDSIGLSKGLDPEDLVEPPTVSPNPPPPNQTMQVVSDPTVFLTGISVLVELGGREVADPALSAALGRFRRAANVIARAEDALVFNGRTAGRAIGDPPFGATRR